MPGDGWDFFAFRKLLNGGVIGINWNKTGEFAAIDRSAARLLNLSASGSVRDCGNFMKNIVKRLAL
jgi:hypothetical protein